MTLPKITIEEVITSEWFLYNPTQIRARTPNDQCAYVIDVYKESLAAHILSAHAVLLALPGIVKAIRAASVWLAVQPFNPDPQRIKEVTAVQERLDVALATAVDALIEAEKGKT